MFCSIFTWCLRWLELGCSSLSNALILKFLSENNWPFSPVYRRCQAFLFSLESWVWAFIYGTCLHLWYLAVFRSSILSVFVLSCKALATTIFNKVVYPSFYSKRMFIHLHQLTCIPGNQKCLLCKIFNACFKTVHNNYTSTNLGTLFQWLPAHQSHPICCSLHTPAGAEQRKLIPPFIYHCPGETFVLLLSDEKKPCSNK